MTMANLDFQHLASLKPTDTYTLSLYLIGLYVVYQTVATLYTAYLGPLSKFPGPPLRALTQIPDLLDQARGQETTVYPELHAKYGPVVRLAPNRLSFEGDTATWKDVEGFKKPGKESHIYKDPTFYVPSFEGVHSLIGATDASHARQRKVLSHAFADKTLRETEPMLKSWVNKLRTKLHEQAKKSTPMVDMLKWYNCTTFDIMADLSFNESLGMLDEGEYSSWVKSIYGGIKNATNLRVVRMFHWITALIVDNFLMQNPKVRQKQAEHWNYCLERVERRLQKTPERPDLWSTILKKSEGPDGLTRGEHHATAALFMLAGTETTATALSGTTYYLLRNRHYLDKLVGEIRSEYTDFDDINLVNLTTLRYLNAVLKEGLRMYPPVPTAMPRIVPKGGYEVNGVSVPEGTLVGVHHFSTYRSERHFKDPYSFRPERWLGDPEFKDDHLEVVEPFTVGPRACLGKNLAWHEMRLIMAAILLDFDLELCDESVGWHDQKVFTLWEKKPLWCKLTEAKQL